MPFAVRSRTRVLLVILVALNFSLAITQVASGKIYRWVDENGQLHFSDSPHNIPADIRAKTKEYKPDSASISVTSGAFKNNSINDSTTATTALPDGSISIPYTAREGTANRVIIDVTFNGSVTAPILVDTGSPGLVITDELANRLDLFDQDGTQLLVLISGIGGQQAAARTIIDKISLGSITEQFIPTHIVADMSDAYQGLIGMDILSNYTLTIDATNKRLLAKRTEATRDLPGNRSQSWWQSNFAEFGYYKDFWIAQEKLMGKSDSPYARLAPSELNRLNRFIQQQKDRAQDLYNQLERFARWRSVPRHWRRIN